MDTNTSTVSPLHLIRTSPSGIQTGNKTAQKISVIPTEQVSPLLVLPNELLVYITNYLPFVDFCRLALASRRLTILFNTEDRLKKLSDQYYGCASKAYRKIIANRNIPAVPGNNIKDPLLRLTYHRRVSNEYLASLESNVWQTCVATLNEHAGSVNSVTALADGRLVSCSGDSNVRVWDLSKPAGQQCVATLNSHPGWWVNSVTALPNGRLVTCADDKTVKVWDLNKPKGQQYVTTLRGHTQWTISAKELPDGRLASVSNDKTIKVWYLSKPDGQQCMMTLNEHTDGVRSVTVFADGRLVSCSDDKTIKV